MNAAASFAMLAGATFLAALPSFEPAAGAVPGGTTVPPVAPALSIRRSTLENGLRVVLNPDPTDPNVAVSVTYDVGSRNENPGRTGFAHLFEHMMFEGSRHVAKGQFFKLITLRGGSLNGTTDADRTNYFEVLPSPELALALWLEADRMKALNVTRENVENQRAVVEEEYRMRVSNVAYAEGEIRLRALAFEAYFPYEHDPIGSMTDLEAAKMEYVSAFHDAYYAPDNAVLTIAGNFDPDDALGLVRKYFGDARRRTVVPLYDPPPLPEQRTPRFAKVRDANAKTPAVFEGWVIPRSRTPEHYALELAGLVLGSGESSRLHEDLVRGSGLAQSVSAATASQRGPDLFVVQVVLSERGTLEQVEHILHDEIARLARDGPSRTELAKANSLITSGFLFGLESSLHRANELGEFELFWGDARLIMSELARYRAVTNAEVRDAARKYLEPDRRSVVRVLPVARDSNFGRTNIGSHAAE